MTRKDLIKRVAERNEMSIKDATEVVKSVFETIEVGMKEVGKVSIAGFGNFVVAEKAARPERVGRNPQTGETMTIEAKPATKTPKFKASKALKEAVL